LQAAAACRRGCQSSARLLRAAGRLDTIDQRAAWPALL
jgi:hypothetical protein